MTFQEIANEFGWGSQGFIIAVETHIGIDATRDEIQRIADQTTTPDGFMAVWENETWWLDSWRNQ